MILSRAHRFIFVKGVKVAGTSVEIALSAVCGPQDILTPITPIDELNRLAAGAGARNYTGIPATERAYLDTLQRANVRDLPRLTPPLATYYSHMPLRDVLGLEGESVKGYRVLCVERNPYAKILSWANHQLSFSAYQAGGAMVSDIGAMRAYLAEAVATGAIVAVRNIDRYRGREGKVVAEVMRFERLADDFRSVMGSLGLACPPLPHVKKGILADRLDPREFLNREQIARVNATFGEEFSTFGYRPLLP
jgi:hypothetical protein